MEIRVNGETRQKSSPKNNIQDNNRSGEIHHCHRDEDHVVEKLHQDIVTTEKRSKGQSDFVETTGYANSVNDKPTLVQNKLQDKLIFSHNECNKQQRFEKETLPENIPISANDKTSRGRTLSETTINEGQASDKNMFFPSTRKGLLPVKAIENEIMLHCKRTPLLAVVKPAFSSQILRNLQNTTASQANCQLSEGNPIDHPAITTDTVSNRPPSALSTTDNIVQTAAPQPKLPDDAFNQRVRAPEIDHDVAKEDQTPTKSLKSGAPTTCTDVVQNVDKNEVPINSDTLQKDNTLEDRPGIATSHDNKRIGNADFEDFCFSDEDEESIPRAIETQIDRIETFLKNDRLRLSKKRKIPDE